MPVPFLAALGKFLTSSAGSTLVGSLGSSLANHISARALANNAYRQNMKMWNIQNQYNSPSGQVSRLIEAGLNPALAYGGSSQVVGNSDNVPQLDYKGVYEQPLIQPDAVMAAQQAMSMAIDRKRTQSEIEKNAAITAEALASGKLKGAEARYAENFAIEKLKSMRLMNDKTYLDTQKVDQEINNLIATRNLTREQIRSLELANELNDRIMEARVLSFELQNRESIARSREIYARIKKYGAEIGVLQQTAKKLATENSFLPSLLTADLGKSITSIHSMNKNMEYIDGQLENLAVKTGLAEKELKNWFWTHIFMPTDQALAKDITTLAGAGVVAAF